MTEDAFLNARILDQRPIFCWLSNGIRIQGIIQSNDLEAIFVRSTESEHAAGLMMIFKRQISSIMPISTRRVSRNPLNHVNNALQNRTAGRD
jgi:RNA chaperone Hfq